MTTDWFDKWVMQKADKINRKHELVQKAKYAKEQSYNSVIKANGLGDEVRRHDGRLDTVPDLTFKMYHAENGYVMEVRHIDKKTERQSVNLHVITDNQDLGEAISHILTIESLKL